MSPCSSWSCSAADLLGQRHLVHSSEGFQSCIVHSRSFFPGRSQPGPSSCSQSTSTRPSPRSNDDALGSSCRFSPLGSSNSVLFTTNTKSAIIPKPLAYRTAICAGMIFLEAAMTLAGVQSSGFGSSWCRSCSGLPPLILSRAASCPATSVLPLYMFGWINYSLNMPSPCCPESLCSAGVCRLKPPATITSNNYLNLNVTYITNLFVCCFVFAFGASSVFPPEYFFTLFAEYLVIFVFWSFKTSGTLWPFEAFLVIPWLRAFLPLLENGWDDLSWWGTAWLQVILPQFLYRILSPCLERSLDCGVHSQWGHQSYSVD